jgi:hypothetical protein
MADPYHLCGDDPAICIHCGECSPLASWGRVRTVNNETGSLADEQPTLVRTRLEASMESGSEMNEVGWFLPVS